MTSIPATGDASQPREWSISNRSLILSAGSRRVLAVLNGQDPLLLPPGSVLQFDDPPGELVVTGIRVVAGDGGGIVCLETEPKPRRHRGARGDYGRPAASRPASWLAAAW